MDVPTNAESPKGNGYGLITMKTNGYVTAAGYLGDYRCGSVNRSDAGGQLLQFDDFADSLRLCFTHEVDTGRQGMHIIRAGMKVEDPAAVYREE